MVRRGALLLHGFTGTPFEVAPLGDSLRQCAVDVAAPLLAGHGTTGAALNATRWTDWYESAERALLELAGRTERRLVVGNSMGGLLGLCLARRHPHLVDALVTVGTPTRFPALLRRTVDRVVAAWPSAAVPKLGGSDVRCAEARRDIPSLDHFPLRAFRELCALQEVTEREAAEVTAPVLIVHALRDHTAPYRCAEELARWLRRAPLRRLTMVESYHLVLIDVEREVAIRRILAFARGPLALPVS